MPIVSARGAGARLALLGLRVIALEGDRLVETDRCELDAPITGPAAPPPVTHEVSIEQRVPDRCMTMAGAFDRPVV